MTTIKKKIMGKTTRRAARNKLRAVLVTTEFRGVFFGYTLNTTGDNITLVNARNCIYWSAKLGGFGGLAVTGPGKDERIGAQMPSFEARKVSSVAEVTPLAVIAWEAADVYRG